MQTKPLTYHLYHNGYEDGVTYIRHQQHLLL